MSCYYCGRESHADCPFVKKHPDRLVSDPALQAIARQVVREVAQEQWGFKWGNSNAREAWLKQANQMKNRPI